MPTPASPRARLAVALVVGLCAAAVHWWYGVTYGQPDDLRQTWAAARALLAGGDPYVSVGPSGVGRTAGPWPLVYPLPAVLAMVPFAMLSPVAAASAFTGVGFACLAYATTGAVGWVGLLACVSGAAGHALLLAQWSPLVTAGAALPLVGALALAAKPTVGVAALAYRADRRAIVLALAALAVSLVVVPGWPAEWWRNTRAVTHLRAPVTILPLGPLVLLAALRWRRPEARLLLAIACVPQTTLVYETLPLVALLPRRPNEALVLAVLTWAVLGFGPRFAGVPLWHPDFLGAFLAWVSASGPWLVGAVYLPCLVMVLRRPNEGTVPAWLESIRVRQRPRHARLSDEGDPRATA